MFSIKFECAVCNSKFECAVQCSDLQVAEERSDVDQEEMEAQGFGEKLSPQSRVEVEEVRLCYFPSLCLYFYPIASLLSPSIFKMFNIRLRRPSLLSLIP